MNLLFLSLSVFSPIPNPPHHPPFPLLPVDERQALPQTEISPVISTEAHSRWGKNVTDIIKLKGGRIQASMFAEKIYTSIPPFCFICPFYLCSSSVKTGTSFGQHLKMLMWRWRVDVFLFFLRQGPQHDQWKWFGFIWCLFCLLYCCLDCWGMAYQIKITSIQCSHEGVCKGSLWLLNSS